MRSAVNQAGRSYNQATDTADTLGGERSAIGSSITPFLTQEMLHPTGVGQQGLSAETAAAEGGAGGATAGFAGQAAQRAAASNNAGGFQAALDEASRNRAKAAAGASEGIAADNERLKQEQSQHAAGELGDLYRTDTSGMLNAMGQEHEDINSAIEGNKTGWFQNTMQLLAALNPGGKMSSFSFGGGK